VLATLKFVKAMGRLPSVILCLFWTCALGTVLPTDIEDGFFPGRSGNMLLKPNSYQDPDCSIIFLDQTDSIIRDEIPDQISIYNVADLIGRSFGVSPIHQNFDVSDYIKPNFFNRPMANLFIELDSIGDHILTDSSIGIDLNYLTALRHGEINGFPMKMVQTSYPANYMTFATSLISGRKPSEHGIVENQWKNIDDSVVHGYSKDLSTWSQVANLPDLMWQTFRGKSLIVSLSGDEQNAKVNSLNPELTAKHPTWSNYFTAHFRPETMDYLVTANGDDDLENLVIKKAIEDLTAKQIRNDLENAQDSVLNLLSNAGVDIKYREGFVSLHYTAKDKTQQYVRYDLTLPEDVRLFSELHSSYTLIKALDSPDVKKLVQDDFPDFYSISFSSIRSLTEKYGRHSAQVIGALYLLDKTIPLVVDHFSMLYPNRLLSEVVLLGSHQTTLSENNPDKRPLISIFNRLLPSQDFFNSGLFPSFYIDGADEKQSIENYCKILDLQLKEEETGFHLFCLPTHNVKNLEKRIPRLLVEESNYTGTSGYYNSASDVTYADVNKYQIVLWISLLMIFTTVFTVYSLAYMSFKKDTLIYSTFNPKWENREAKRNM